MPELRLLFKSTLTEDLLCVASCGLISWVLFRCLVSGEDREKVAWVLCSEVSGHTLSPSEA